MQDKRSLYGTAALSALALMLGAVTASAQTPAPPAAPMPEVLQKYTPVTAERLRKPADGDWLHFRRTYDGWGYSPLAQITPENASRLRPVWVFSTGVNNGHQAPPIVNNGVMFVATPGNQVIAIEAKTGKLLWRYVRPLPEDAIVLHPTNRGVAVYGNMVYFASGEAVLVALDAKTGKEVWTAKVDENKNGYYMSLMPLVADGRVMVGVSGGELGIRGYVAAYDAGTGKEMWKAYAVPAPGEPGSETWPRGDQWKTGGGSVWVTGNYDPETNIAYWGTGNGGPWMGDQRPGDNLYTTSTIAIDVATGKIKGHFQYHPNDSWDWDEVSPPILIDYRRGNRNLKGLINVARNGYMYFLERTAAGPINFVDGKAYVYQDVFKSLDPKTGRPDVDLAKKPMTGRATRFCPSLWGGKDWPPAAYSPKTRLLYVPANDNLCGTITGGPVTYKPGERFTHGGSTDLHLDPNAKYIGELQAWNVDNGRKVWSHKFEKSQNWGPVLTTGGGLVFMGGTNDRMFRAWDASNGKLLWEYPTNSGITAVPVSYTVEGKQYIAVQSGWGIDARGKQNRLNAVRPGEFPPVPEGGAVWVFAVR